MLRNEQIKMLKIRSWRRGIKELDLILGKFVDLHIDNLNEIQLNNYEELLYEDDHLLYLWLSNREKAPSRFEEITTTIITVNGLTY